MVGKEHLKHSDYISYFQLIIFYWISNACIKAIETENQRLFKHITNIFHMNMIITCSHKIQTWA